MACLSLLQFPTIMVDRHYSKKLICFSKQISKALKILKDFNYQYIYKSEKLKINHKRIEQGFDILFRHFMTDLDSDNKESYICRDFLNGKSANYLASTPSALKVRDYISGMTDRYFTYLLRHLVVPEISLGELQK